MCWSFARFLFYLRKSTVLHFQVLKGADMVMLVGTNIWMDQHADNVGSMDQHSDNAVDCGL